MPRPGQMRCKTTQKRAVSELDTHAHTRTLALALALAHSHTGTHAHSHTGTHAHTHTRTLALSHLHSRSLSHTRIHFTPALSHTRTLRCRPTGRLLAGWLARDCRAPAACAPETPSPAAAAATPSSPKPQPSLGEFPPRRSLRARTRRNDLNTCRRETNKNKDEQRHNTKRNQKQGSQKKRTEKGTNSLMHAHTNRASKFHLRTGGGGRPAAGRREGADRLCFPTPRRLSSSGSASSASPCQGSDRSDSCDKQGNWIRNARNATTRDKHKQQKDRHKPNGKRSNGGERLRTVLLEQHSGIRLSRARRPTTHTHTQSRAWPPQLCCTFFSGLPAAGSTRQRHQS